MKKKFFFVSISLALLFIVSSGFVPFSLFKGMESPFIMESTFLNGTKLESPLASVNQSFDSLILPYGWKDTAISNTYLWTFVSTGSTGYPAVTVNPHSGAGMTTFSAYSYSSGAEALLISSAVNNASGQATVGFWMYRDNGYSTTYDSVGVWINTTPNLSGTPYWLGNVWRYSATNNWYSFNYNVPTSYNGSNIYIIFKAHSAFGNNMFLDDVSFGTPSNMGYLSSNTVKINPGAPYAPGTLNSQIVQVQISDTGAANPFIVNRLKLGTGGSNNPALDITNAKLWYTRSSATFSTARQYGSTITSPNGVMNFSDTATLDGSTTNYFWLTYDISPTAVLGDSLNARCDSIFGTSPMGGQVPTTVAPIGANIIDPYCIGTFTNSGLAYGLYIANVNFGSINNTSGCPGALPYVYSNYTNLSTVVRQNNPYPMILTNQNIGNPNPTAFAVWIDWNNNYSMLDPGEWYPSPVIPANTTTTASLTINVPTSATLGAHRMRIKANLSAAPIQSSICALQTYGEQEDYTLIVAADTNMTYSSSTTTQSNLTPIFSPSVNQHILGIQVVTFGNINPTNASAFSFSTTGSTNPSTDITNAKLWYTGINPNFATTTFIGSTTAPNGPFTINGSRTLAVGTNYFWLTYDVPSGAIVGDSLDAQCNSLTVGGIVRIPAVIAPPGKRPIGGTSICGTYTIPGNYPSIAAAITDINSKGGVTCPTVFNVAANYVEVAVNLVINATGTATNTITFQKSGSGANPRIISGPGVGTYDGVIILNGVNYYTFDGIDISDTSANTTTTTQPEWGYALLRPSGTQGCQYNTIKNCNITLNKTNTSTNGIFSNTLNTLGIAQTITSASGTNSNNSFLSNNISNCFNGIYLYSFSDATVPHAKEDQNNVVSTTGTGRSSITNFGGTATTAYGIYAYYQRNPQILNTLINSNGGTASTGVLYGIYNYAYYNNANTNISGDTVTLVTAGTAASLYGIYNYTYSGVDNYITNNVLTGFSNPATGAYYTYYIYNYNASGSTSYQNSFTVTGNKIIGNTYGTSTATGGTYGIYSYDYCMNFKNISNNLDSGNTVLGTTSYSNYSIYSPGTVYNARLSNNRIINNILCGTTSTGGTYGILNSGGTITCIMDSNVVANNTMASTSSAILYSLYNTSPAPSEDFSYNTVTANTSAGTGTIYGLYFSGAPGLSSTINIVNNNITNLSKTTATGTGSIYGIYHGSSPAGTLNINNNTITGFTSAAATIFYGIYQIGSPPNYVNFINNKIGNFTTGGAATIYGINNNPSATTIANISQDSIFNLTSLGGTIYGLYSVNGNPVNIYKNSITGLSSTTSTAGIVYGLYVAGGTIQNVYNNIISDLNAPASTSIAPAIAGIYLGAGTYDNVYDNTVYLKATSTSVTTFGTCALYANTAYNLDLRNNILVDNSTPGPTGGVAAAYRRSSITLTSYLNVSNNNCFYAGTPSANHLLYYDGTNLVQTMAALKTLVVPRDNNSCTEMPPFINSTTAPYDLHISTSIATQLESGGQTITAPPVSITDDRFGTARFPNSGYPVGGFTPTAPDIGAHEFGGLNTNSVGPFISYTALGIGGTSNRAFNNVIITDPNGVNTTAGTKPRCYYKRSTDGNVINDNTNGTDGWKYVEANGTTSPFDFTIDYSKLNGGTGVIAGQIVNYFVIAQDLSGTPNVAANQATFTTAPTTVALVSGNVPVLNNLSYTIGTGVYSGVYNVGTAQTFTSLTGAAGIFAALNAGTVSGDVTISITSDLTEDGTNQLNALNETGVGRYKVKIVPASASVKTISGYVTTQAMIRLNGVRRVTVDGNNGLGAKYLLFRNKNASYPTIQFQNETGIDTVKNCTIEGQNTNVASGILYFSTTTNVAGIGNDSICVNSCDIRDRSDSTAFYANAIYSIGTSNTLQTYNNYNSIINCNIFNNFSDAGATQAGIYLTSYNSNWVINNNSFYQTVSRVSTLANTFCGIYVASTLDNDINITNNYFGGTAPLCAGGAMTYTGAGLYNYYAMYLLPGSIVASSVQGNVVKNINLTTNPASSSSVFFRGIYIPTACFCNVGNITGNTIGSGTGTGSITLTVNTTTTGYNIVGIYHLGIGNMSNNTVGSITLGGNAVATTAFSVYGIQWSNTVPGWTYTMNNNLVGSITTPNSILLADSLSPGQIRGLVLGNGAGTINNVTNNIVANGTVNAQATTSTGVVSVLYGFSFSNAGNDNITNNTIYNLTLNSNCIAGTTFLCGGITNSSTGIYNISQNTIYSLYYNNYSLGVGLNTGMFVGGAAGTVISKNKIYDLRYSGTAITTSIEISGIFMAAAIPGTNTVSNNIVSITNGDASTFSFEKPKDLKHENITIYEKQTSPASYLTNGSKEKVGENAVIKIPQVGTESALPTPTKSKTGKLDAVNSVNGALIGGIVTQTGSSYKSICNYYYNTVYIGGSQPGSSGYNSWAFLKQNGGELEMKNNIFVNARTGGSGYHYVIGNEAAPPELSWYNNSSNNNLLVGANTSVGEWGLGNFVDFATWKASSLGDANSISDNPTNIPGTILFRSLTTGNLNIDTTQYGAAYVYQKGTGIPGINTDYNGYPRVTSGPTCIGAHEFALNGNVNVVLLTPANNATLVARPVSMVWRKSLFASSYRIQISNDSLFNNLLVSTGAADSVYSFTTASPGINYWWRVNPVYSTGANGLASSTFKFTTAPIDPTALAQINFNAVIIPQIMSCGGTTRMPVVIRATVTGLTPNVLYRYYNGGAAFTDIGALAYGAGNPMFMNPDSLVYKYTSSVSLTTAGGYDQFRASSSGTFTGWFGFVNTANARFAAGKYIIPSIQLGDSLGVTLKRYALNDSIKVVNFSSTAADTCGTGVYGISVAFPRNIVSIFDNTAGTGKPLSQTYLEVEGVTVASIAPFYTTNVEGQNGRWGTVIPNLNANGVKRVEQRNLSTTGALMTFNTDADGIWPSGANTVNPAGGLTPVGLLINDAPLLDYPVLVSPANNATGQPVNLTLNWNTVPYASSYRVQLASDSLFTTIVKDTTQVPDSLYVSGLLASHGYWWRVAGVTTTGTAPFGNPYKFTTGATALALNLKAYLEGFWDGATQVVDTVNIYLASSTTYALLDSQKVVLGSAGTVSPSFSRVSSGNYYIVVKHRNHLETWSALPQAFVAGTPLSYDFTTAATQAYGSNMKQVGSVWVFIVGDANQDGSIDASDVTDLLIPEYGNIGYLSSDFNGDGSVDAADVPFMIANYGLTKVVPSEPLLSPEIRNQKKTVKHQELDKMIMKKTKKTTNNNN